MLGGFSGGGGGGRGRKNHIAEMFYDPDVGSWSYSHLRADKQDPNYIDTVMGVLMEQVPLCCSAGSARHIMIYVSHSN